jgi:hypothetical protein
VVPKVFHSFESVREESIGGVLEMGRGQKVANLFGNQQGKVFVFGYVWGMLG